MWAEAPPPPWATADEVVRFLGDGHVVDAPIAAHAATVRMARHPATLTKSWYDTLLSQIDALDYVEMVGIVCLVAATTSLRRTLGLEPLELPTATDDDAIHDLPPTLADARLNWVPVAAPADATAAVVQALTAVPRTNDDLWRLADVQYIPDAEMVDPRWTRGTMSRPEMELVAVSVSAGRECHY